MRQFARLAAACLLSTAACGCGNGELDVGPVGRISGEVTFDGEPVTEGTVDFYNDAKGAVTHAAIGPDGHYTLKEGTPTGDYVVTVSPPPPEQPSGLVEDGAAPPPVKEYPFIPQQYRSPQSSGLSTTITEGDDNTYNVEMISGG